MHEVSSTVTTVVPVSLVEERLWSLEALRTKGWPPMPSRLSFGRGSGAAGYPMGVAQPNTYYK